MHFIIFITLCIILNAESVEDISPHSFHEIILCRFCGSGLSSSNHIISKSSLESEYTFIENLFSKEGVLVQVLRADYILDVPIVTFNHSECSPFGEWSDSELWFPEYKWKPCICAACGEIVGWVFKPIIQSKNQKFFALDLHSLVGEHFLNLLTKYPKI